MFFWCLILDMLDLSLHCTMTQEYAGTIQVRISISNVSKFWYCDIHLKYSSIAIKFELDIPKIISQKKTIDKRRSITIIKSRYLSAYFYSFNVIFKLNFCSDFTMKSFCSDFTMKSFSFFSVDEFCSYWCFHPCFY